MNVLPFLLLFGVVIYAQLKPEEVEEKIKKELEEKKPDGAIGPVGKVVCKACTVILSVVRDVIGGGNNVTRDGLETALGIACKYTKHWPGHKQVCEKLGPDAIETLYAIISSVDNGIKPEHDCQILHLCPKKEN